MRKQVLLLSFVLFLLVQQTSAQYWRLSGNSDATATSILGTLNSQPVRIYAKNLERMRIDSQGRVAIGTTPSTPSAILEVGSTTKGVLLPRMTTAQRNAIPSPATGLLVYQTDGTPGLYYYSGGWKGVTPSVSGFANTALSNLSATTAINQNLLPGTTASVDLGSSAKGWKNLYLTGDMYIGGARFLSYRNGGNSFFGSNSGSAAPTGSSNTGGGTYALQSLTSGSKNSAGGYNALYSNTTGSENTAHGANALFSNTTAWDNTAVGLSALYANTDGYYNTAVGSQALHNNTSAYHNTAIGYAALYNNTSGGDNTATGFSSLQFNQSGTSNTANGYEALLSNSTGSYNSAFGNSSLINNAGGYDNTALGYSTLNNNTSGGNNTAVGWNALYNNTVNNANTALGIDAGYYNSSISTFLGAFAYSTPDLENVTVIGYNAYGSASNSVVIGNTSVTSIGGQVGWTAFSDGRYKKNLKEEVPGLSFINKLRPVTYNLDVEGIDRAIKTNTPAPTNTAIPVGKSNGSLLPLKADPSAATQRSAITKQEPSAQELKAKGEKAKIKYTGFVAQEVEKAATELNYDFSGVDKPKNSKDFYGLRYSDFVVPLVKAVQELSKKADEVEELKKKVAVLEELVNKLTGAQSVINNTASSLVNLSSAYLEQSTPNPSSGSAIIRYHVPATANSAGLMITDMKGSLIKTVALTSRGNGQLNLSTTTLAAGSYTYTLYVNGAQVDAKQMIIAR